jgi:hypothetical protein
VIPRRDLRVAYPADPRWSWRPTLREIARAGHEYRETGNRDVILRLFGLESAVPLGAPPDAGGHTHCEE